MHGLAGIPLTQVPRTRKDYTSDQEVRWCPGYGDYVILSAFRAIMADLGIARENTAMVSGIGCSSRFPYYAGYYGMHSIHDCATAIATGVAAAREGLNMWVITGDSGTLSIGGNHLTHTMWRNVSISILLFNNRIYGLTKGQCSPTSERDELTKSTPYNFLDVPFNPVALALGTEASFVARAVDSDRVQLAGVMNVAARHRGAALIGIYQNRPIFNDETFDALKDPESANALVRLRDGEPAIFDAEEQFYVVQGPGEGLRVAETATAALEGIVVHDAERRDPSQAFALAQLTNHGAMHHAPAGIFRRVERPAYDDLLCTQVAEIHAENPHDALRAAMSEKAFWEIIRKPIERAWPGIPFRVAGPRS